MNQEMATQDHTAPPSGAVPIELGDLLVNQLWQIGVEYVFGVPGGAIEPLYNALARSARRGGPRAVVARHESGAAFMADGYSRETGRLGVCCATTGPGATNLITGVASAYADKIPMLVITAQTALPHFGRGALQESSCTAINTVAMFQHCTHYSTLVSHPDQLEAKLIAAIMVAFQPPGGPVHISIPRDVLATPWHTRDPGSRLDGLLQRPRLVDKNALETLCNYLKDARKLVLLVGSGAADSIDPITDFAELTGATIIATPDGKPWVDVYHPQFHGVFGFAGHESARAALLDKDLDFILAIGTGLDEFATSGWDRDALLNEKLIHIDSSAEHFTRSPMAKLHLYGSIPAVFETLVQRAKQALNDGDDCPVLYNLAGESRTNQPQPLPVTGNPPSQEPPPQIKLDGPDQLQSESAPIKPQRLICELTRRFPPDTRFVADAGNSFAWTTHYLHPQKRAMYRVGMGFGTMAWAIGAAVGTALGCHDKPVVCITGDGSFLMSGQELTVAVAERLPVIFVILNDRALGMVKHGQRLAGAEQTAYELPPVNFAETARSMGAEGYVIESPADFDHVDIDAICKRSGPTVLDVRIDPEEVPPMGMRVKTLAGFRVAD